MPRRGLRGRTRKHVQVRLPGNHTEVHYKKDRVKRIHCSRCGQMLGGIPSLTPERLGQVSPTSRKVTRPFGAQLCHNCLRQLLKQEIRTSQVQPA